MKLMARCNTRHNQCDSPLAQPVTQHPSIFFRALGEQYVAAAFDQGKVAARHMLRDQPGLVRR